MAKRKFGKDLMTGLKALAGMIIHSVVMLLVVGVMALIAGGLESIGPFLMLVLLMVYLISGVYILGVVYNRIWGWK